MYIWNVKRQWDGRNNGPWQLLGGPQELRSGGNDYIMLYFQSVYREHLGGISELWLGLSSYMLGRGSGPQGLGVIWRDLGEIPVIECHNADPGEGDL